MKIKDKYFSERNKSVQFFAEMLFYGAEYAHSFVVEEIGKSVSRFCRELDFLNLLQGLF